jgi:uncharacterized membrane protein
MIPKVRREEMRVIRNTLDRFSIAAELLTFFWERKLWWLIPMMIVLLAVGLLLVFAQGSAIAPFIYTLF